MQTHSVVSVDQWIEARKALLAKEKEHTRQRDELTRQRQALPWVKVEKNYTFDSPQGPKTLADLFRGKSQLFLYHFMLGPGWKEGCVGCSFLADHVDGARRHFENHDLTFVAVSRAPLTEILPFQERMGWEFPWVSSNRSDFNYDFHVSFRPEDIRDGKVHYNFTEQDFLSEELAGISTFYKDGDGAIYHTYSTYGRGGEALLGTYSFLDFAPLGRNETGPRHDLSDWVRHHDRYQDGGHVAPTGRYVAPESTDEAVALGASKSSCCHGEDA